MGFDGNFLTAIKNIYSSCISTENVIGYLTENLWINLGVHQGDGLSPTLFGL